MSNRQGTGASNFVQITEDHLMVRPRGINTVLSFRRELSFPLKHVRGATVDDGITNEGKGVRGPGLGLPNVWRGTFTHEGEKTYWNLRRPERPLVIQLAEESFSRLILGVADPEDLAAAINRSCPR